MTASACVQSLPHADRRSDVGDVKDAVGRVRGNAARFGVDPAPITQFGESAGGHLARLAATPRAIRCSRRRPRTGTPRSVPCSTSTAPPTPRPRAHPPGDTGLHRRHQVAAPRPLHVSSPVRHVRPGLPATLSIHGEDDRLIRFSQTHLLDEAPSPIPA
ncbi:hypothetical protein ACFW96_11290 [Streptomyces gardneri]|uniref:hypothetical protein n=1 Tax=Streptomyces gardneri TaxID=66892 RepID=UPI0036B05ED3